MQVAISDKIFTVIGRRERAARGTSRAFRYGVLRGLPDRLGSSAPKCSQLDLMDLEVRDAVTD